MIEYGIFNDEGCIARGFWSRSEALADLLTYPEDEGTLTIEALCPVHDEQPERYCEDCNEEEE